MAFTKDYLNQIAQITQSVEVGEVERAVDLLATVRTRGGRLFLVGVGGSASNASHAVNDFRKICDFECYTPTDNVSELSARINDEGWDTSFSAWLKGCRMNNKDALMVLSVGGGNPDKGVSINLVEALKYAKSVGASTMGIVGRDGGYTRQVADVCCLVPVVEPSLVTFHAETFQSVLLHLIVAHPKLKTMPTKWEELQK